MGYEVARFVGEVDLDLLCPICHGVLEDPKQASQCEHAFCSSCITEWLAHQPVCPVDHGTINVTELISVPRILRNLLMRLTIQCEYATFGCPAVIKLEVLHSHQQDCEFNPRKVVTCELGCELPVLKDQLGEHNCVRELRGVVQQQQIKLTEMQMDFSELRMQHNQLKHDLRSVKDSIRGLKGSRLPYIGGLQINQNNEDITRWVATLPHARVSRWGGMISTPDATLQAVIRRSLMDCECPAQYVEDLMESAHERRWPVGLSTLEMRQLHRRQYDNYVCRRIPGKQAVLVMACENVHMPEDLVLEPGIVMIFAHGVE